MTGSAACDVPANTAISAHAAAVAASTRRCMFLLPLSMLGQLPQRRLSPTTPGADRAEQRSKSLISECLGSVHRASGLLPAGDARNTADIIDASHTPLRGHRLWGRCRRPPGTLDPISTASTAIQALACQSRSYISEPGVVSFSPVSSSVFRPERIIGQPP